MKFPSYLFQEKSNFGDEKLKEKIFVLSQSTSLTDINGEISIKILLKSTFLGIYAINFYSEGGLSDPIQFQTEFPPDQIYIKNQAYYNFTLMNSSDKAEIRSKYLRSGDFITPVNFI